MVTLLNAKYEKNGTTHRMTYDVRLMYNAEKDQEAAEQLLAAAPGPSPALAGMVETLSIPTEEISENFVMSHVALFIDQFGWGCLSAYGPGCSPWYAHPVRTPL